MATGAAGLITTHDPAIADVQGSTVRQVHFSDALDTRDGSVVMTFDYALKPGPATTTNALRILEKLGLR
jgi:DNA mismatch repair ATPase MutS